MAIAYSFSGWIRAIKNIDKFVLSWVLVCFLNGVVSVLDVILDLTIGYTISKGWRHERAKAKDYEHSAQVVNILFRGCISICEVHTPKNFLLRHVKYVNPKYILEHDNITLMGCDDKYAWFCVTDPNKPDQDILDNAKAPFMFIFQLLWAQQLVMIPLTTLFKLGEEVGDPNDKVVTVVDMTGRCGSTLLCQMLARLPTCRAFSETYAFTHSHKLFMDGVISYPKHKLIIQNLMRLLCKPENKRKITHILIKNPPFNIPMHGVLRKQFPKFKFVFASRHIKPCVTSYLKLRDSLPEFYKNTQVASDFFMSVFPALYDDYDWLERRKEWFKRGNPDNHEKLFAMSCSANFDYYLKRKAEFDHVFLYEDFMKNVREQTETLFDKIELSKDFIDEAMKATKMTDSQNGVFGGRGLDKVLVNQEMYDGIDSLLKEYNSALSVNMSLDDIRALLY